MISNPTITKIITMDCGHRLSDYVGKCRRIHGHTYRLEVTVGGKVNEQGMIVDFSQLKEILVQKVENKFDHKLILKIDDILNQAISKAIPKDEDWICWVDYNPTAENMVFDIFEVLKTELKGKNLGLKKVVIWETPSSFAEVSEHEKK